jgi:hypothetical protein
MQKSIFILFLAVLVIFTSCNKIEEVVEETPATGKVLFKGTFSSAAHPTTGDVEIIELNGVKKLSFKNLKSDAGPDLRIYLAQDLGAKTFTEITNKVNNGTYTLDIPTTLDPAKNKYVLIWCRQFSVLFGSAELK